MQFKELCRYIDLNQLCKTKKMNDFTIISIVYNTIYDLLSNTTLTS